MLNLDFRQIEISDNFIYRISVKKGLRIEKVGVLKDKPGTYYINTARDFKETDDEDLDSNPHDWYQVSHLISNDREDDELPTVIDNNSDAPCIECQKRANKMFATTLEPICEECLDYWDAYDKRRRMQTGRDPYTDTI